MVHRHSLVSVGQQVTVPRKHIRAVGRGLRNVLRAHCATNTVHGQQQLMLDEALHHAMAFQERSAKRWREFALGPAPSYSSLSFCTGRKETPDSGSSLTMHHLANLDEEGGISPTWNASVEEEGEKNETHFSFSFSEKQQARLYSALQQWVLYSGFRCSRTDFMLRQSKVSAALLLSPSRVIPTSRSSPEGAGCLEGSLRRRGAQAYVDLLVHHKLAIQKEEEWTVLCDLCNPVEETQERKAKVENAVCVVSLPFLRSSSLDASWERSLAVLSWAREFCKNNQQTKQHISSTDIAEVLQRYVQHFGDRVQVPGLSYDDDHDDTSRGSLMVNNLSEEAVVTRLRQWWMEAREAEKKIPKLAEMCKLDRTAPNQIHVEGRKLTFFSSNEASAGVDTLFAELLLQGRWEDVLHHIQTIARDALQRNGRNVSEDQKEKGRMKGMEGENGNKGENEDVASSILGDLQEECQFIIGDAVSSPSVLKDDVLTMLFNRPRPVVTKGKLWVHATASRLGRVPRELFFTPETSVEKELLKNPPTPGLRSRRGGTDKCTELQQKGHDGKMCSSAVAELRHKIWIHSQLPRYVPHSIVRFEGTGASMIPYLRRCPAKELAPWLLLCTIASVAQKQRVEDVYRTLNKLHMQTLYTLFLPVPYYAAFQEYCAELLIQLGTLLAPPTVMRMAVHTLLRPPSFRHFYDVLKGRRVKEEVACRQLWWGSLESPLDVLSENTSSPSCLLPNSVAVLEELHSDSNALKDFFMCKAASLRNYHVSSWIESSSKVIGTLEGLLDILVEELNRYGPPLLSPEAATALLTAIILLYRGASEEKRASVSTSIMRGIGTVYFVVPADRVFGAAPYFKGIYHESYIHSTPYDWGAEWNDVEALLVGRSIRRTTKYPTTTRETFFRVEHYNKKTHGRHHRKHVPTLTFRVPKLRLRLMTLDILEALHYFEGQRKEGRQKGEEEVTRTNPSPETCVVSSGRPGIVARHLPFGVVAINKPAGMSTTLHAAYPHLIDFLTQSMPWKGNGIPVLFQHGLVNRIDVGTSGLVLAADEEASLGAARRASVVDRRVEKTYRALVLHCPPPASRMGTEEIWYLNPKGVITRNVFANGADYSVHLAVQNSQIKGGLPSAFMDRRPATTMYRVLRYYPATGVYDVEVKLRTGRRHQIRQHFAQLCHPLVGDGRYHERAKRIGAKMGLYRPALHASRITLFSPSPDDAKDAIRNHLHGGGEELEKTVVECPLPEDMKLALLWLQEQEQKSRNS